MEFIFESFEDFLKNKDNSVNEKRVTYKRRYTENYPAKKMNSNTKIRSKILEAIGDGIITEEEFKGILKELQANSRWFKRNSHLFKVTENGIKLSKTGRRMFKHVQVANPINEEEPEEETAEVSESYIKTFSEFINEAFIANPHDAVIHVIDNYKKITGSKYDPENISDKDAGKIERFVKKQKLNVGEFWDAWIEEVSESKINESVFSEMEILADEAKDYKEFKKEVEKQFNTKIKTQEDEKWLKIVWRDKRGDDK